MGSNVFANRYEVQRRLAVGGMGEVFLAKQLDLPRPVVLKTLLPDLALDAAARDQFLHEARLVARLNHPNVVAIYEVGELDGVSFIAMEYVDGWTLARWGGQGTRPMLPREILARVIRDAARALHHAHTALLESGAALDIVHRDVSPQNLMIRRDGAVKVLDFGIARSADRASFTRTGQVKGKLAYMAPEQLLGQPVDGRTDLYALSVVLYEQLTGLRWHVGLDDSAVARSVLTPEPPSFEGTDVPEAWRAVVLRGCAFLKEERYPDCAAFAEALEPLAQGGGAEETRAFLEGAPAPAVMATPRPFEVLPGTESVRAPASNQRFAWSVAGVLVAAALGVGAWRWSVGTASSPALGQEPLPRVEALPVPVATAVKPVPAEALPSPQPVPQPSPSGAETTGPQVVAEPVAALPSKPVKPKPPPQPVAARVDRAVEPSALAVDCEPWCMVVVDGVAWSSSPVSRPLGAGHHVVVVTTQDGRSETHQVEAQPGKTEKLKVQFKP